MLAYTESSHDRQSLPQSFSGRFFIFCTIEFLSAKKSLWTYSNLHPDKDSTLINCLRIIPNFSEKQIFKKIYHDNLPYPSLMFWEFYKVILFLLQSIKLPINYDSVPFGGSSSNLGCSHIFKIMTSSDFFGNENIFLLISLLKLFWPISSKHSRISQKSHTLWKDYLTKHW